MVLEGYAARAVDRDMSERRETDCRSREVSVINACVGIAMAIVGGVGTVLWEVSTYWIKVGSASRVYLASSRVVAHLSIIIII